MAYRNHSPDKVPVSSFSFGDWAAAAFALTVAAAAAWGIMMSLLVLAGMPGPFLWFGSGNDWADIGTAILEMAVAIFLFNLLGAITAFAFFQLIKKIRANSTST